MLTCCLASGASAQSRASGAPTHAQLLWSRPASSACPSAALLEREVEELAGHRVFVPAAEADVIVRGSIAQDRAGVHAWFEARAPDGSIVGTRELDSESDDCSAMQHSLALVLTILLDRPPSATASITAQPQQEPPSETSDPAADARRNRPHAARSLHGGAWFGLLSGTLPRLSPGVGLTLELGLSPKLRLRADGVYWLPRDSAQRDEVSARFSAYSGGLALCPRWPIGRSRVALRACAGGQLGAISASPRGLDRADRQARLLAQATLELGLEVRLQRLTSLFLSAGSAIALTRPRFLYDRTDETTAALGRPSSLGVISRIGLTIGGP